MRLSSIVMSTMNNFLVMPVKNVMFVMERTWKNIVISEYCESMSKYCDCAVWEKDILEVMVNLKRGGLGEELGVQLIQKEHKNVSENARLSCQPHPLHLEADHQTCGHRPHQETNKFSLISVIWEESIDNCDNTVNTPVIRAWWKTNR